MARPPRVSPDRILAVAAAEFAARGFAGARVDRIARTARVNKAMLYYHFHNKKTLYRTVLRQMFAAAVTRLEAVAALDLPAPEKLERMIVAIAEHITSHTVLPNMMLREITEGGAHLDRETLAALAAIPATVARVVAQGVAEGEFREVHPIFAYFSILAPIVMYFGATPIRREMTHLQLMDAQQLEPDLFVRHLQETMRRALAPDTRSRHDRT